MEECLFLQGKRGYDTEHFCKVVMTSDYEIRVMTGDNHREWSDEYFLLSGFEKYVGLVQGETYLSYEFEPHWASLQVLSR